MSAFRIVIDRSLCSGFGSCLDEAPAVFELDGSGIATARLVESDDHAVLEAATSCPMGAISVYDALTNQRAA